jgi:hypothetical protein
VEPTAVRVDLGGVGEQGAVADVEVLGALDPGGDLALRRFQSLSQSP